MAGASNCPCDIPRGEMSTKETYENVLNVLSEQLYHAGRQAIEEHVAAKDAKTQKWRELYRNLLSDYLAVEKWRFELSQQVAARDAEIAKLKKEVENAWGMYWARCDRHDRATAERDAIKARIEGAERVWIEWDAFPNPVSISRLEFQASNSDNDVVQYIAVPVDEEGAK